MRVCVKWRGDYRLADVVFQAGLWGEGISIDDCEWSDAIEMLPDTEAEASKIPCRVFRGVEK